MIDLLLKPNWNYKDVMAYLGCKKTKAYEIMTECKKFHTNTRDSVLASIGTSVEREIYIHNLLKKGGGKNEETL